MNKRIQHTLLWGVLIAVIAVIVSINVWAAFHKKPLSGKQSPDLSSGLDVHHQVPDFSLIDQDGSRLGRSDLRGKIWVADFIFTNCLTICPLMTDKMVKLQEEFQSPAVRFVSFSVDPERDTPDVLNQYAKRYDINTTNWSFLTGDRDAVYELVHKGFSLAVGHQGDEILHSTRYVLLDRDSQIRGYYDSRNQGHLQQLRRDLRTLLMSK